MTSLTVLKLKAKKYSEEKKYSEAENIYLSIINNNIIDDIEIDLGLADIYYHTKKFDKSKYFLEKSLEKVEVKNKDEIYSKLGDLALALNQLDVAIKNYTDALLINQNNFGAVVNLSVCYMRTNKFKKAIEGFNQAKIIEKNNFAIYINSGLSNYQLGLYEESIDDLKIALEINPNSALAYFHLGNGYLSLENYNQAEQSYKKSLQIDQLLIKSYINLGVIYQRTKRNELAVDVFTQAINLDSNSYIAFNNRGSSLKELGLYDKAISDYLISIKINDFYHESLSNIATTYLDINQLTLALEYIEKALNVKPDFERGLFIKGLILNQMNNKFDALKIFLEIERKNKKFAENYNLIGLILTELGHNKASREYHNRALELEPASLKYNWDAAFSEIPVIIGNDDNYDSIVINFEKKLLALENVIKENNEENFESIVGRTQPYYLAYLNNNNKDLLMRYGNICRSIMSKYDITNYDNKSFRNKLKFGIVSANIRYHSVWNAFLKGIVTKINKESIDLNVYYLDSKFDSETQLALANANKFEYGIKTLKDWIDIIKKDNLDVILYPEIGMNQKSLQLASIRLAKTQLTSWGHPETSGLPTLDYFLSSVLTEDESSQNNYSEKLIKLSNLGCFFEPPSLEADLVNFQDLGIKNNRNILLCLGLPNKFHPENDWIYIELIKRVKNVQLVFMKDGTGGYQILENRLKAAFSRSQLNYTEFVVFIPYLSRMGFNALMQKGTILLDTLYFSHFNTSMQALGNGTPVVTRYGNYMRSRATSAMLKVMDLNELIANSDIEYIEIIIKLTKDNYFYNFIKSKITNNVQKLYRDMTPIKELEQFLLSFSHND
jgi:predicted O-linked N-acetylglucosamine transferase (SPINDLY family)